MTSSGSTNAFGESGMRPADVVKDFEVTISEKLVTAVHRAHKHKRTWRQSRLDNPSIFSREFQIRRSLGRQPGRKIHLLNEDLRITSILLMRLLGSNFSVQEYLRAAGFEVLSPASSMEVTMTR